jgi:hypothetical protein
VQFPSAALSVLVIEVTGVISVDILSRIKGKVIGVKEVK